MIEYTTLKNCVLCNGTLHKIKKLCSTPLADDYSRDANRTNHSIPLTLAMCESCKEIQLLEKVSELQLFSNYTYRSNTSPGLKSHFEDYAKWAISYCKLEIGDKILDIGSNDGLFLSQFSPEFYFRLGIEPSRILNEIAEDNGVPDIYEGFFNKKSSEEIHSAFGKFKLITANNVFAHSGNLPEMLEGVKLLLDNNGYFVFEVSYLPNMINNTVFDFIYHEHLMYHRYIPLKEFFQRHGMRIVDIIFNPNKGGTARFIATKSSSEVIGSNALHQATMLEKDMKLDQIETFIEFFDKIDRRANVIRSLIFNRKRVQNVICYGASATTTTLLSYLSISHHINLMVDDNHTRHGTYSPIRNLKVVSPQSIKHFNYSFILVAAWRFAHMIVPKCQKELGKGNEILVPFPNVELIHGWQNKNC